MLIPLYRLLRPALFALSPETAHERTLDLLATLPVPRARPADPVLATQVLGHRFATPLGLAAGFDKGARVVAPMLRLGFGFVEVGTVTPLPQPGNPKPRLFRDAASGAVINRMGFNGEGMAAAAARLRRLRARAGPVGINVGRNKLSTDDVADYVAAIGLLGPLADYLVINVSSPNTPGLRALQAAEALTPLLAACLDARAGIANRPPLLVKIAPDLSAEQVEAIAATVWAAGAEGLVISNTTLARPSGLAPGFAAEAGGLSGRPLLAPSTALLRVARRAAPGLVLIGVGGVASGADAYAKLRAGASLVQLYSALVFDGPGLIGRITRELAALLRADGFSTVAEAVGTDA